MGEEGGTNWHMWEDVQFHLRICEFKNKPILTWEETAFWKYFAWFQSHLITGCHRNLPQGGVLELSVPQILLFLSCTAQQHKGHVKFISKARSALFGFVHWSNSDITETDVTGLTHATIEFFSESITVRQSLYQFYLLELLLLPSINCHFLMMV